MSTRNAFWDIVESIINPDNIVIDRPKNSTHPEHEDMIYPVDYGYILGTNGGDGEELDVYVGTLSDKRVVGMLTVIAIDSANNNTNIETKILYSCTQEEIMKICEFQNQYDSMKALLTLRDSCNQ